MKLSDDVIEETFTSAATICRNLLQALRSLPGFRRFQFNKRAELFIGVHNEALSVAGLRVSNPGSSWGMASFVVVGQ